MKTPPVSESLRRAWQATNGATSAGPDCPSPDQIWEAQEGGLARDEVCRIVEHTVACSACAEAWRLARNMGAMQARELLRESSTKRADRPPRLFFWRPQPLALVAGLACLVLLGSLALWLWPERSVREVAYRTAEQKSIRTLVSEELSQPRSACLLRWTPGPSGTRYTIRVSTEDLMLLSVAEGLDEAKYLVPPSALQEIPGGARLLWQVQAFLPDGGLEISKTFFVLIE